MNLVILGPQGCGKGTQAEKLAEKFNLEHMDMGKFLREVALIDSPLGKEINEIVNVRKEIVNDEILEKVLDVKLKDIPREQGIVFDGVPRREDQLEYFNKAMVEFGRKINRVIFINISERESIERISKRRVCGNCKSAYVLGKNINKEGEKCPKCGGIIIQRPDDKEEGVKTRLAIFKKETLPLVEHLKKDGLLIEVNGEQTQEKVFQEILNKIKDITE